MKRINILTFNKEFFYFLTSSKIYRRNIKKKRIVFNILDIFKLSKFYNIKVDQRPIGGGPGMVISPNLIEKILLSIPKKNRGKVLFLSPLGLKVNNSLFKQLSLENCLTIVSGKFLGPDLRIVNKYADLLLSIGDFVVSNGDLCSALILDGVVRNIDHFLGNSKSLLQESFSTSNLLGQLSLSKETFLDKSRINSKILKSGDHVNILKWKRKFSLLISFLFQEKKILKTLKLSSLEYEILKELKEEIDEFF